MKKLTLFYCILFMTVPGFGQEVWSLEKCIRHALDNSLDIESAEITNQIADVNLRQAKHGRYPNFNLSSNFGWNFGRVINPNTNDFETEN